MSAITTCSRCGDLYEESSEESANDPERLCSICFRDLHGKDYDGDAVVIGGDEGNEGDFIDSEYTGL